MSTICVVIGRTRHKMVQIEIQEAAKRGAEMIELRLDFLARPPDFKRLLDKKPCPMVATVRRAQDGGRWSGSEASRKLLLRQAVAAGFDWIDLEEDVAREIPRFRDVKRIVSYHNLREVPDDLEDIHRRLCQLDADVVKVTVSAQEPQDNLRVLALIRDADRPTVAYCMGDIGVPSRVLTGIYGAPFTYAAFNKERGIAPGIISFQDMQKVYHYAKVTTETKVFGVIGDPVAHSLGPVVHNAALEKLGIDAVYLPFRVPRGFLPEFLEDFEQVPVQGYSVTLPHKEAAATEAKRRDPAVTLVGAANTLVKTNSGFSAFNTDYQAALDSIRAHLATAPEGLTVVNNRTVLVLGAGGVARAVVQALHQEGALVSVCNRTPDKAQKLAEEVGCRFVNWDGRHGSHCDILVNCTSVGMHPNLDEMPIHQSFLRQGLVVVETVYTPETTLLVKEARERGCHVLTGVDMFVRQAALQFKLFTGQEAPLDLMFQTVKRALSPVALRDEDETTELSEA
jgi:3-dehydroquinate dehydratase / shikimate dehydrogenase